MYLLNTQTKTENKVENKHSRIVLPKFNIIYISTNK